MLNLAVEVLDEAVDVAAARHGVADELEGVRDGDLCTRDLETIQPDTNTMILSIHSCSSNRTET